MTIYQGRDFKKPTGGYKSRPYKVKRWALRGGEATLTTLGQASEVKIVKGRGNTIKLKLVTASHAVVSDPKTGLSKKARILGVVETPANREYARRGIIVKGSIIMTELGKAVVTSRPSQDGVVNAVLVEPAGSAK
ncbi:MAG: 30S ribosomal protein S8e [Acidilobaceae archaeon]